MKEFKDHNELYKNILGLQEEIRDLIEKYIEENNIDVSNFEELLYGNMGNVENIICDKLNKSERVNYLLDNTQNFTGDLQIVTAFIKGYVTSRLMDIIIDYEEQETTIKGED